MGGYLIAEAATGQTVYNILQSMSTGQLWNGSAMEAYNQSHIGNYAIATSEQSGSGRYILAVPGGLPSDNYWASSYIETVNPGTPTLGDTPLDIMRFGWLAGNIVDVGSGVNVGAINGSTSAAVNLAIASNAYVVGAAAAGTLTTSSMTTNLAPANAFANMFSGRTLIFTSGVNAALAVLVTAFAVTGGKLTFVAYGSLPAPSAPSNGDTFLLL